MLDYASLLIRSPSPSFSSSLLPLSLSSLSVLLNINPSGHYGSYPLTGDPRSAQLSEGVIYATITLGTACPQSWSACGFLLVTCSEIGACPRRPLPSSSPHGWSCTHIVVHFSCPVSVLLCYSAFRKAPPTTHSAFCKALPGAHSAFHKAATVEPGNMDTRLVAHMVINPWLLGTLTEQRTASWSGLSGASHPSSLHTPALKNLL